ncbi:MAG TPA: acyl-CoA dehydrogenase family protein [Ureibacillus sp.]|nr:acyl-CoA dehydrogenase family protein [Ureibacillus sp.]
MIQTLDKKELYADLMERATRIGKLAESEAMQADIDATVSQNVANAIRDEEIHRLLLPKEYGYPQIDFWTYSDFIRKVSYYNLSAAWITCFFSLHNAWVSYLPKKLRDEVVASDGFVADVFAPMGKIEEVEGGYLLSGQWNFVSGILYSEWVALGALMDFEGSGKKEGAGICVRVADLKIEKNWNSLGLRGSGSNTVIADKLFVTKDQILRMNNFQESSLPPEAALGQEYDKDYLYYNIPWFPGFYIGFASMAVGGAERIVDEFKKNTEKRVRLSGVNEHESPTSQRVLAEITMELHAAKALLNDYIANMYKDAGNPYNAGKYKAMRAALIEKSCNIGYRSLLTLGGHALLKGHPVELFTRDLMAIATHKSSLYEDAVNVYGKELFGFPIADRG